MTAQLKMRRIILAAALLGLLPSQSLADDEIFPRAGIYLDQFRTAETIEDGFAISRPDDRGDMKFGAHLTIDYANDPLVYERSAGDSDTELENSKVVEHHMVGTLSLHLGIADRLVLFASLPVNLWMDGDGQTFAPTPDISSAGDPWLGARLRLVGEPEDVVGLGLQAHVTLPITEAWNDTNSYMGERGFTVQPELLFEIRAGVRITANVGAQFRKRTDFGNIIIGNELRYGLGVTVPLVEDENQLNLHAELYGATPLGEIQDDTDFYTGNRETSPLEATLGLKFHAASGFAAGVAAGPGLLRGYGSPDIRVIGQIGWAAPLDAAETVVVDEPVDAVDTDGDGILDPDDACPNEPEDVDTFEDNDGCPDPDNDADGILDADDQCPLDAEDTDGFEDEDGCPDTDNDKDGVADADDQCPMDPEDVDTFEDTDGCPDADNDKDGVPDTEDACPLAPGKPSENPEENGCPKTVRVDTETGQIQILKRVEFATNKDRILSRSFPILQEVKDTIMANPQIKKIRVEGHTDDRGKDQYNMDLSKRRAKSVMTWLHNEGVEAERLEAYGCGEVRPIDSNKSKDGRQNNRRVEFHILEPAPPNGVRSAEGCEPPVVD